MKMFSLYPENNLTSLKKVKEGHSALLIFLAEGKHLCDTYKSGG